MSGSRPPGWYPGPGAPHVQQWWDGIRWTGEVRDTGDTRDTGEAGDAASAGDGDGPAKADGAAKTPPENAPAAWRAPAVEAWQAVTAPAPPPRRGRWLGRAKRRPKP